MFLLNQSWENPQSPMSIGSYYSDIGLWFVVCVAVGYRRFNFPWAMNGPSMGTHKNIRGELDDFPWLVLIKCETKCHPNAHPR